MTVSELTYSAVAEMGGDLEDLTDYEPYAIPSINKMLADLFEINNAWLADAAETELTDIPSVTATTEDVPYIDRLTRNVMVYGLARDLARRDNNPAQGYYTRMYDENKRKYNIATYGEVTDNYAEEDDA